MIVRGHGFNPLCVKVGKIVQRQHSVVPIGELNNPVRYFAFVESIAAAAGDHPERSGKLRHPE
jgi:hypothetical protein